MACGCAERKKLNDNRLLDNNIQLANNKILKLDSIQNLSIEEIVNLYKDGYQLEQLGDNIKNLTYGTECSGTATIDRSNTTAGFQVSINMNNAFAQKFTPTSRCLQSVTLRAKQVYANQVGIVVYITPDVSGHPDQSNWMSMSVGTASKSYSQVPDYYTDLNFVLNTLLPNTNPFWLVVIPDIYDPNYDTGLGYLDFEVGDIIGSTTAMKTGTNNWSLRAGETMVYKTWKLNYSTPPSLNSITISPSTATINIGSTQQLTAVCKDQNNNTMTCPTLTWASDNPTVASVNSSGLVTANATGIPANITASAQGKYSNASAITVTSPTQVLTTISISPTVASINIGSMQQLTAICRDQNNSTMTCPVLSWASSDPSKATVNSSGQVTGVSAGNTNITASAQTKTSNNSAITVNSPGGATCQSITTPTAAPSTIGPGDSTTLRATVTPSSPTSQEFSVQFMDGDIQIENPVTTINRVAQKTWIPTVGTHSVSAKVGSECASPGTVSVVVNPGGTPEAGGAGIVAVIAVVAAAAILMSKKG